LQHFVTPTRKKDWKSNSQKSLQFELFSCGYLYESKFKTRGTADFGYMLVIYGYFSMNHPIPIPIPISPGREVLDDFLRQRAKKNGATLINGLFMGMALPEILGEPLGKHWIGSGVQLVKLLTGLFGKSSWVWGSLPIKNMGILINNG
jgi:hypothetical protein